MLVYTVGVPQPAGGPCLAQELAHQIWGGLSGHTSRAGSPLSCHSIPHPADAYRVPGNQLLQNTVRSQRLQDVLPSLQNLMSLLPSQVVRLQRLAGCGITKVSAETIYMHQREAMLQQRKLCSTCDQEWAPALPVCRQSVLYQGVGE